MLKFPLHITFFKVLVLKEKVLKKTKPSKCGDSFPQSVAPVSLSCA